MTGKRLYLLRHGDTGLPGRYIGSTDAPLSRQGREQVRRTGRVLAEKAVTKILCSPLLRCRQTLTELNLAADCQFSELLREVDFGRWEGKNFSEIVQEDQSLVDSWVNNPSAFVFPDGESLASFTERVARIKAELTGMADDVILVVAHGGIIRYLLCLLLGLHIAHYLIFDIKPGYFCSLRLYGQEGVLTGFNIKG